MIATSVRYVCFLLLCYWKFCTGNNNVFSSYDYYNSNTMYNVWDLSNNSTDLQVDEDAVKWTPTEIFLREATFSVGPVFGDYSYRRLALQGLGSLWKQNSGIGGIWIDLRQNSTLIHDPKAMKDAGINYDPATGKLQYSLTYTNQRTTPDIIHAHGQQIDYKLDGTPFLSDLPLQPGDSKTYNYEIDLQRHNGGTFFLHSHSGFAHTMRSSVPLIIQQDVPEAYSAILAKSINSAQEIVMFLEDFCLAFTDEDDAGAEAEEAQEEDEENEEEAEHEHNFRAPGRCENPFIVYRQVFAEWNKIKRPEFLGPDNDINTCMDPVIAPEFGPQYILINDKTYDQAQKIYIKEEYVRLRIINSASMVNFRIDVGTKLIGEVYIIAIDGHLINPVKMNSVWIGVAQRIDLLIELEEEGEYPILAITEAPITSKSQVAAIILVVESQNETAEESTEDNITISETIPGIGMLSQNKSIIIEQEKLFHSYPINPFGTIFSSNSINTKIFPIDLTGYNGILGFNKKSYQFPPMIPYSQWSSEHPDSMKIVYNDHICINFTNFNWDTHPIHLHGHHFIITEINGNAITNSALRDTILIPAGSCSTTQICFIADNKYKGIHGLHCHMAIHEMAGMFITLEYDGYDHKQVTFPINSPLQQCDNNDTRKATEVGLGLGLSLGILLILVLGMLCKNRIQSRVLGGKTNSSATVFEAISLQPQSSVSKPANNHNDDDGDQ